MIDWHFIAGFITGAGVVVACGAIKNSQFWKKYLAASKNTKPNNSSGGTALPPRTTSTSVTPAAALAKPNNSVPTTGHGSPSNLRRQILLVSTVGVGVAVAAGGVLKFLEQLDKGAKIAKSVLELQDNEKKGDLKELRGRRIFYMMKAFELLNNQSKGFEIESFDPVTIFIKLPEKPSIRYKDRLPLQRDRLHVPPELFVALDFEVRYDKKRDVVMMRYASESACIVFSSTGRFAYAYYHPNSVSFNAWWNYQQDWMLSVVKEPEIFVVEVGSPPILDRNKLSHQLQVPVRVFAGALSANPRNRAKPGDQPKTADKDGLPLYGDVHYKLMTDKFNHNKRWEVTIVAPAQTGSLDWNSSQNKCTDWNARDHLYYKRMLGPK